MNTTTSETLSQASRPGSGWERLTRSDEGVPAWEALVRDHAATVYRVAYRLTGDPHDAEDLTQDTFARAFRSMATTKPANPGAWLHRITLNLYLDQVRRTRRAGLRVPHLVVGGQHPMAQASAEQVALDSLMDANLRDALMALQPMYRVPIVLHAIYGLTYQEIARVMGIKRGTVGCRISRGHARLRVALSNPSTWSRIP